MTCWRRWRCWWVGLAPVLVGCPGDVAPGGGGDGSSTGPSPGITTFNSTVDPTVLGEDDGESAEGTTIGGLDDSTTAGGVTSETGTTTDASGTTDAETTSGPGGPTDSGTTGPGCPAVGGNYESCLDPGGVTNTAPCMSAAATCLITGGPPPTDGVCAVQGCVDVCDCPAAPPSGSATVSCDDVTGDPTELFCHLDCAGGQSCPTGMSCFGGFICLWSAAPAPPAVPYGDCLNNGPAICGAGGVCLNDNVMAPTIGVCSTPCMNVGECPASPGGTAPVACQDITTDLQPECFLDCSGAGTVCPAGMSCFGGFICAWT